MSYSENMISDLIDGGLLKESQQYEWIDSEKELPIIGENVEVSEDRISIDGTLDYTDKRHCILSYSSSFGHNFGIGFATDGSSDGCEKGLKCDTPRFWRRY